MYVDGVLLVDECTDVILWQAECVRLTVPGNHIFLILRIQTFDLFETDSANIGYLFKMKFLFTCIVSVLAGIFVSIGQMLWSQ